MTDDPKRAAGLGLGQVAILALVGLIALAALSRCVNGPPAPSARAEPPKTDRAAEKVAEAAEQRRQGFHCLSRWDGSHKGVVALVKATLRDPESFRHLDTLITAVNAQGIHRLEMEYTARNGFGGVNRERAVAAIDNTTCEATLLKSN